MTKLAINLSLTRWPKWSLHARAVATPGMPLERVLSQLTGFAEALQSDELKPSFLREHVGAYLAEAFASGTAVDLAKVYGDDSPMGEDWRIYIDGSTEETIARTSSLMEEMLADTSVPNSEQRYVRFDTATGRMVEETRI